MSRLARSDGLLYLLCGSGDRPLSNEDSAYMERVTRSMVLVRDQAGPEKCGSELQIFRAACRNRIDDLRITRVSPCVARELKTGASFMFAGS
jgi:hypothetical protein